MLRASGERIDHARRVLREGELLILQHVPEHRNALLLQVLRKPDEFRVLPQLGEDLVAPRQIRIMLGKERRELLVCLISIAAARQHLGAQVHAAAVEQER